jgi:hypothetical protein
LDGMFAYFIVNFLVAQIGLTRNPQRRSFSATCCTYSACASEMFSTDTCTGASQPAARPRSFRSGCR